MDLLVYFCRARSSAQGHKSVRVGRVFHHAAAEDYLKVCNTSHGKKLSWKKEPKHQILEQGMAGEGISLTEQLQAQTLRFANSQPLIKKTPLYNMDIKYKLENVFIFHNPCSVFGRKHYKLTTKRGKVTDYAVNFTVVQLTPVCIDDRQSRQT